MPEDSRFLSLSGCRQPPGNAVVSAEVCVIWASAVVNVRGFRQDELLHIARSFARSEVSHLGVQIMLTSPFALCRIYSNGRVVVMGKLTENEARHQLTRIVYKLRYRTKWKVLTQPRRISHGNGLQWCYVVDRRLVPVKTALEDAKIDQLYFKFQFEEPFELRKLLQKGREEKRHITSISPTCLRLQVDLPQRQDDNLAAGAADQNTCVWDAGIYLELELEEELARAAGDKGRYGTCIIYRSGKVAILGCCSRDEVRFAFESLVELL